jgi:hypothetical protein
MTKVIRIDTAGEVTRLEGGDLLRLAHEEFEATDVVACHIAPILEDYMPPMFVMVIDDFGAEDMPINYKAWALYGRSPIYGNAYFAYDASSDADATQRPDLPDVLVETVTQNLDLWVDEPVIAGMKIARDRPEMLTPRPTIDPEV